MNLAEYNTPIHGLVPGILYGQNARVDELNDRAIERIKADVPLHQNIDVRAVPTKYARFPVIDRITMPKVGLTQPSDYSVSSFAPTQSRGPVDGFLSQVNTESELRNQYFAIQSAPQAAFIPDSKSDLYNVTLAAPSREESQPYPGLFDKYQMNVLAPVRNADSKVGSLRFMNNTRTQLRGGELQG
jgi:hypothetical protein